MSWKWAGVGGVLLAVMSGCGQASRSSSEAGAGDEGTTASSGSATSQTLSAGGTATAGTSTGAAVGSGGSAGVSSTETTGSGGSAGAQSSGERERLLQFAAGLARAACEREVRCGEVSSLERCLDWRHAYGLASEVHLFAASPEYLSYFAGADVAEQLLAEYELADAYTLAACITDYAKAQCSEYKPIPSSCQQVYRASAPRAQGQVCSNPNPFLYALPCQEGLQCVCGFCDVARAPLPRPGEPCSTDPGCERGSSCVTVNDEQVCQAWPALGQPCRSSCTQGFCSPTANPTCVARRKEGELCGNGYECQRDLVCEESLCVAKAKVTGEACARASGGCLGFCVFDAPDASQGTCGDPNQHPEACSLYDDDFSMWCPSGYTDNATGEENEFGYEASCECVVNDWVGAACEDNTPCTFGYCAAGSCQPWLLLGDVCTEDVQCSSGFCDPESGVCRMRSCAG